MNFSQKEHSLLELFKPNTKFLFQGEIYKVNFAGKPTSSKGEPKTDVYINASPINAEEVVEIKISYKKINADFLENKISKERAKQIFGQDWKEIIKESTKSVQYLFKAKKLIYKSKFRKTNAGSITLGWRFELTNKPGGNLSGELLLTRDQLLDVYSGINLEKEKINAIVNGSVIKNSGIANYILVSDNLNSTQEVIDQLESIEEYVKTHPKLYFVCKALNYRSLDKKYEGNRPLAVQVNWTEKNNKLNHQLNFDAPLSQKGTEIYLQLKQALDKLDSETTDDLNDLNVINYTKITHE